MLRLPLITKDGSYTFAIPEWDVTYHSIHGAIAESVHVYVRAGMLTAAEGGDRTLQILELGFGTGLNAVLTCLESSERMIHVHYAACETDPIPEDEAMQLNYGSHLENMDVKIYFEKMHKAVWEKTVRISPFFTLQKYNLSIQELLRNPAFTMIPDVVYYDAFAPSAQPELWSEQIFKPLHARMALDGILVTYCSKSSVRRALEAAGFLVEKLPGPPGKREMIRAIKTA